MTDNRPISTLKQFYTLMAATRDVRSTMVEAYMTSGRDGVDAEGIGKLEEALEQLTAIPEVEGRYRVSLDQERTVDLDLGYEIGELEKDLFFFKEGEEKFLKYLGEIHSEAGFGREIELGLEFLGDLRFNNFVTDRDGTINNYCGRYRSSVQSAYNAVFLSRFIRNRTRNSVLITSAPLANPGVLDVTVCPPRTFIYAASKAREFVDADGNRRTFPIRPEQQEQLDALNKRLEAVVARPEYEKFGLIGSGLQFKFGQTTIAHQDISKSVSDDESEAFVKVLEGIVREVDPGGAHFALEDTGLDLEIILKLEGKSDGTGGGDFDKGDGLLFLDKELGLKLNQGPSLVCGDTGSDLKLVETCVGQTSDTWTIFVTRDKALAEKVKGISANTLTVPEPDVLVTLLNVFSL